MNKHIRRIAIFCGCCSSPCCVNATWVQDVQADELDDNPANRRAAIERYAQPRGDIIVGGKSGHRLPGHRRAASATSAPTPTARCTRRSPATPRRLRHDPAGEHRGRHPLRHRHRLFSAVTRGRAHPQASSRAATSSPPSTPPRSRPPTTGSAARRARWPRSTRRPARSWRWSPRPRTTRAARRQRRRGHRRPGAS